MTIESYQIFLYTLTFVVPGFLLRSTIAFIRNQKRVEDEQTEEPQHVSLLWSISLSAAYLAVFGTLIYLAFLGEVHSGAELGEYVRDHTIFSVATWFCLIVVGPIVLGNFVGTLASDEAFDVVLGGLGLTPTQRVSTAWSYQFQRILEGGKPVWVQVTLKDGSTIAGCYYSPSMVSTVHAHLDMYLHDTYLVNDDGQWTKPDEPSSVLIKGEEIAHVFFWDDRG